MTKSRTAAGSRAFERGLPNASDSGSPLNTYHPPYLRLVGQPADRDVEQRDAQLRINAANQLVGIGCAAVVRDSKRNCVCTGQKRDLRRRASRDLRAIFRPDNRNNSAVAV